MLAATLVASAAPASADEEAARAHFRRGIDLYDRKQWTGALAAFRAAYAERPSPGIKQNVGLCLEALGEDVLAAQAYDEALEEGRDSLKPEVKAQIASKLESLAKSVGTISLRVVEIVSATERGPVEGAEISVDDGPFSSSLVGRPLRVAPGIHVFRARARGFDEPPPKKLSILAGSPVDATFEVGAPGGMLTIRPNVEGARVRIDGVDKGPGPWSGKVPAGAHRVEVAAPGHLTTFSEVVVSGGATVDYPVALTPSDVGVYEAPKRTPPAKPKKFYVVPSIAGSGVSYRFAPVLGEPVGGTRRTLSGVSFGVRGGYRISDYVGIELATDAGVVSERYELATITTRTSVTHWQVTPALRFTTTGKVRVTMGTGLGVHGLAVEAEVPVVEEPGGFPRAQDRRASGIGASWLVDLGVQFDVGSVFLEFAGFLDMHGVGTTEDDTTGARVFLSSPSTRYGLRLGIGIPF